MPGAGLIIALAGRGGGGGLSLSQETTIEIQPGTSIEDIQDAISRMSKNLGGYTLWIEFPEEAININNGLDFQGFFNGKIVLLSANELSAASTLQTTNFIYNSTGRISFFGCHAVVDVSSIKHTLNAGQQSVPFNIEGNTVVNFHYNYWDFDLIDENARAAFLSSGRCVFDADTFRGSSAFEAAAAQLDRDFPYSSGSQVEFRDCVYNDRRFTYAAQGKGAAYRIGSNTAFKSLFDAEVAVLTDEPTLSALTAPVASSSAQGSAQITVDFTDPNTTEAGTQVEYKLTADSDWTIFTITVPGVLTVDIVGLTSELSYDFRTLAVGDNSVSSDSPYSNVITESTTAIPQLATPVLSTGAVTDDSIVLSWTFAGSETFPVLVGYRIEESADGVSGWTFKHNAGWNVLTATITGLDPSTQYYYRIRANGNGTDASTSDYSNVVNETTTGITTPLSAPTAGTATVNSATSVTVAISGIDVNADSVAAYYKLNSSGTWILAASGLLTSITEYDFNSGLTADVLMDFSFIAEGSGSYSDSPRSNTVSATPTASGYGDDHVLEITVPTDGYTFTLSAHDTGVYNANIEWGDGEPDSTITTYDDSDLAHTYATAGVYELKISGTFPRVYFNNAGSRSAVTGLINWGDVGSNANQSRAYWGCNIPAMPTDAGAINFFNNILTDGSFMMNGTDITTIPSGYILGTVTNASFMFQTCLITDVSNTVTFASANNLTSILANSTINTADYSALLVNIEANNTDNNTVFGAGSSTYNATGEVARNALLARTPTGWTITDGGLAV